MIQKTPNNTREKRRAADLCTECADPLPAIFVGKERKYTTCLKCRSNNSEQTKKYYAVRYGKAVDKREKSVQRQAQLRAEGKCIICRKPSQDSVHCEKCAERIKVQRFRKRQGRGPYSP